MGKLKRKPLVTGPEKRRRVPTGNPDARLTHSLRGPPEPPATPLYKNMYRSRPWHQLGANIPFQGEFVLCVASARGRQSIRNAFVETILPETHALTAKHQRTSGTSSRTGNNSVNDALINAWRDRHILSVSLSETDCSASNGLLADTNDGYCALLISSS